MIPRVYTKYVRIAGAGDIVIARRVGNRYAILNPETEREYRMRAGTFEQLYRAWVAADAVAAAASDTPKGARPCRT